ncbi:MAG TPA: methyltransferase, partial [Microscillaceae bacterium]|nr:methyltransferase [Microscillaceae bacterium]
MANTYFSFQQFTIQQDKSPMKVCTDSCILGAMACVEGKKQVLDIGTGTGLLTLMMAQRNPEAYFTALEIDALSVEQAQKNFAQSPWSDRLKVIGCSLQAFSSGFVDKKFDFIVSNPPFFSNHLKPHSKSTKIALHNDDTLPFEDLCHYTEPLLAENGEILVMYPGYEANLFLEKARAYGLICVEKIQIKHYPEADKIFRTIVKLRKVSSAGICLELVFHICNA